jgi:hypothetical protein
MYRTFFSIGRVVDGPHNHRCCCGHLLDNESLVPSPIVLSLPIRRPRDTSVKFCKSVHHEIPKYALLTVSYFPTLHHSGMTFLEGNPLSLDQRLSLSHLNPYLLLGLLVSPSVPKCRIPKLDLFPVVMSQLPVIEQAKRLAAYTAVDKHILPHHKVPRHNSCHDHPRDTHVPLRLSG